MQSKWLEILVVEAFIRRLTLLQRQQWTIQGVGAEMVTYRGCDTVSKFILGEIVEEKNKIKWGMLLQPCTKRTSFMPKQLDWAPMR